MTFGLELLISSAIVIGGTFVFIGSFGLLKLPELMSRLHGPSKATTLGVGGCLIASMLHFWALVGRISIQEFLVTAFLFITAPVTAHFIAKAHLHSHQDLKQGLPATRSRSGWATYESPPQKPSS
ncbi:MAG: Na+/H+ antiporter subunit G [Planctomycetaceae bacterium]